MILVCTHRLKSHARWAKSRRRIASESRWKRKWRWKNNIDFDKIGKSVAKLMHTFSLSHVHYNVNNVEKSIHSIFRLQNKITKINKLRHFISFGGVCVGVCLAGVLCRLPIIAVGKWAEMPSHHSIFYILFHLSEFVFGCTSNTRTPCHFIQIQ